MNKFDGEINYVLKLIYFPSKGRGEVFFVASLREDTHKKVFF